MDRFEFIIHYLSLPEQEKRSQIEHFKECMVEFIENFKDAQQSDNQRKKEEMQQKLRRLSVEVAAKMEKLQKETDSEGFTEEDAKRLEKTPFYKNSVEKELIDFFQSLTGEIEAKGSPEKSEKKPSKAKNRRLRRKNWKKT